MSGESRRRSASELLEQAAYLDVHGGTPFPQAIEMPLSWVRGYFETNVHKTRVKAIEAQQKIDLAVIGRLDAVIAGFRGLAKMLSRR